VNRGSKRSVRSRSSGPTTLPRCAFVSSSYLFLLGGHITNQYDPIRITTNRIKATANFMYSVLSDPPPKRVRREPAKPTIIAMELVTSTVFSK
jgi:hypothetical protein